MGTLIGLAAVDVWGSTKLYRTLGGVLSKQMFKQRFSLAAYNRVEGLVQVRSPKLRIIAEKENSREDETSEIKAKWINRAGTDKSNISHGGI